MLREDLPADRHPRRVGSSDFTSSTASAGSQLKAHERLANYPKRMERLKRMWIDVNGGGQWFNETVEAGRRSGSPMHRTSTPRDDGTPRESSLSRAVRRGASPAREPRAAREPSPAVPRAPRPKRETRRESSSSAVARRESPAGGARGKAAARRGRGARDVIGDIAAGGPLTRRQIEELMSRDLTPEDYELLLLLDEGVKKKSLLSTAAAAALPRATGTDWINEECRICLCALEEDEDVRMLPTCGHLFHAPCAERWLSTSKNTCPLCGRVEEVQEKVINAFGRFDTNGDGLIGAIEMKRVLTKLDPSSWTASTVETLFQSVDLNADGKVDIREFVDWIFAAGAGAEQQLLREKLNI